MIGTLIILYALNSIAPIPTDIFAVAWVIMAIQFMTATAEKIFEIDKK